jgi:hypothetical protein
VCSVIDSVNYHDSFRFEDFVNDAISAAPSGMKSGKLTLQDSANSVGVFGKRAEHELDDGDRYVFWEPVQLALARPGDSKFVWGIFRHF